MRNFLGALLLLQFSSISYGLSLDGTWVEDKKKTMEWSRQHTKIDPVKLDRLEAMIGHLYLKNNNGKSCLFSEPYKFSFNGLSHEIGRIDTENYSYSIAVKNENGFVISREQENGKTSVEIYIFDEDESFYVTSLSTEDFGFTGGRTYFKKVDPVKWDYECKN